MKMNPFVSIIIPVYNGSNYLKEAIDSALNQTYKNLEILVINDGSNDEGATEKIALSYGDKIRYFKKANGGVSSALNLGIEKMSGEYFSWLSHDDVYYKTKIEASIDIINKLKSDNNIVVCQYDFINKDGEKIFRPYKKIAGNFSGMDMFQEVFSGFPLNGCTLLINKEAFSEVGLFDQNYKYVQDIDLWTRFMLNGYNFVVIDDICVRSRIHSQQGTAVMPQRYFVERKMMGIPLVDTIHEKFGDDAKKYLEIYLYDCIEKKHNDVADYILETMKQYGLIEIKVLIKVKIYKAKGFFRKIVKGLYYKTFAPNSR